MKPNYQVLTIPLTGARSAEFIVQPGVAYDGLTIIELPGGAGAGVSLAFGSNGNFIPMRSEGQSFAFIDVCGNPFQCDEGLLLTNPAGAGNLVILLSVGGNQPQN